MKIRVHQRVVLNVAVLVEAETEEQAKLRCADYVRKTVTEALLDEDQGAGDEAVVSEIETTDSYEPS